MLSEIEGEIQRIIDEIENETVPGLSGVADDPESCVVCGVEEYRVETSVAHSIIERFGVTCPNCESDFSIYWVKVKVDSDGVPIGPERTITKECPHCQTRSFHFASHVCDNEADERTVQQRLVKGIQYTQMHGHHTSYAENETIRVCKPCHHKIHNTDGFRDDLRPDMARTHAENIGYL